MKALHDLMPAHTSNSSPSALLPVHLASALLLVLKILHIISLLGLWNLLSSLPVKLPACALHIAGFSASFRSQYKCHILKEEVPKDLLKIEHTGLTNLKDIAVISFKLFYVIKQYLVYFVYKYIIHIPCKLECQLFLSAMLTSVSAFSEVSPLSPTVTGII